MFILSNLAEIGRGADGGERLIEKAAAAGLILDGRNGATATSSRRADAADAENRASPALDALADSISGPTGRRSAERILSRLVMRRGQAASAADFRAAINGVSRLANGADADDPADSRDALARAKSVLQDCGASPRSLNELESTLENLRGAGAAAVDLDFSFVRGLAYYTGVVFEFMGGGAYPLGGGGRYDDLVKAFGGADAPACGFALDVDELSLQVRAPDAAAKAAR